MGLKEIDLKHLYQQWSRRPLSVLAAVAGLGLIIYPLYQVAAGVTYFEALNYIDNTTLIMIGILILRSVLTCRFDTDLQAVCLALIGAMSFVYTFEAVYKLTFYWNLWKIPPLELRGLVIQMGIAAMVLTGFAFGKFNWSASTWIFAGIFILGWVFWVLIGYPQIFNNQPQFYQVLKINLPLSYVYILNRGLKFVLFLIFYSFYSHNRRING
jgi:hypothetical protein